METPLMTNENPAHQNSVGTTKDELKTELLAVKEELRSVKNDFSAYRKAVSKRFGSHQEDLEELEARFEDRDDDVQEDTDDDPDGDMLPIERLSQLKEREREAESEDNPFTDTTASVDRAVVLYENFREWSNKTPKGRVVKDGLKRLMNTALDERISWKQVYRTCRKLQEWSKGRIEFQKHTRFGWILVDTGTSSSVNTG